MAVPALSIRRFLCLLTNLTLLTPLLPRAFNQVLHDEDVLQIVKKI